MSLREYKPIFMIGVLVLFLILTVSVISAFWPRYEERFFESSLLGKDEKLEGYYPNDNSTLEMGSTVFWHIYIHNHMGSVQNVSVRVKLLNSTMEAPDDREHQPSPYPYFIEFPLSLSVDQTLLIPFSWSVLEADNQNGSITIKRLMVNDQTVEVDVSAFYDDRFRIVFELWVYDQASYQYKFGWDSGREFYSVSLYMWFKLAPM